MADRIFLEFVRMKLSGLIAWVSRVEHGISQWLVACRALVPFDKGLVSSLAARPKEGRTSGIRLRMGSSNDEFALCRWQLENERNPNDADGGACD